MNASVTSRRFRCANRSLYFGMMLAVFAAMVYTLATGRLPELWQQLIASICTILTLLWGSFYTTLCMEVNSEGISRRIWFFHRLFFWSLLRNVELSEFDLNGIRHCSLLFIFSDGTKIEISSHLFPPDDVQELRDDLRACNLLPKE